MWIWQGNVICDYDCCCYCYCQINYDIAALALRGKKKEGNERECMIIMRGKRESLTQLLQLGQLCGDTLLFRMRVHLLLQIL